MPGSATSTSRGTGAPASHEGSGPRPRPHRSARAREGVVLATGSTPVATSTAAARARTIGSSSCTSVPRPWQPVLHPAPRVRRPLRPSRGAPRRRGRRRARGSAGASARFPLARARPIAVARTPASSSRRQAMSSSSASSGSRSPSTWAATRRTRGSGSARRIERGDERRAIRSSEPERLRAHGRGVEHVRPSFAERLHQLAWIRATHADHRHGRDHRADQPDAEEHRGAERCLRRARSRRPARCPPASVPRTGTRGSDRAGPWARC